ncbi:hypothetical protein ACLF6K_29795 [Streptomyces xanthophaeus]|uniref:hypothetical protein n=1 Tax=Streptomyces xanthophaeus TaxID=67385 RepID=UPI0039903423
MAEEFGYGISPGPASRLPGVVGKIAAGDEQWRKTRRTLAVWAGLTVGVVCFAVLSTVSDVRLAPGASTAVILALVVVVGLLPTSLPPRRREAREMVRNRPWQVWPCRMETVRGDASSPMVVADVLLLAPDRTVVAALRGFMRRSDWLATTDGRGLIWFCGDLRVGGWVARPADAVGSLTWMDKVDPPARPVELTPSEAALEDGVIHTAISEQVWNLFFDL